MRTHNLPYRALDLVNGRASVDDPDTPGLGRGELMIRVVDLAMELHRFIVEAGFGMRFGGVAGAGAGQAGFRVDIHKDGEIGLEAAARDSVKLSNRIDAQAAPDPLIDQRRI